MSVPAVEAEGLTRSYRMGDTVVHALRGVSLRVEPGEYVAVVGPSGSGKSTLMHLLGGLDRPTSGRLVVAGRDLSTLSANQLAHLRSTTIGFVFQSFHLLPRTSAVDNVALPLVYQGVPARERRERAAALLGQVGLAHRLTHRPNQLSGGEQQRVAIARAVVHEPALVLADEPTGNLDLDTATRVLELLEQSCRRRGATLVMATHGREVIGRADRVLRIHHGRVEEEAS
ncbi:MAG TPA: ABC transporter ATP-binding protein [Natronosporangium sp.]